MANEWTKVELTNSTGHPRRFTVADGTAIVKGTLLKLTSPRTAIACDANNVSQADPIAGVAAEEKEASDGQTSITCWTDGIFRVVASGAIGVGNAVVGLVNNYAREASGAINSASSGAIIMGYALEAIADGSTGSIRLRL